jgi:tetratricopeptide (TPR) repeat protein
MVKSAADPGIESIATAQEATRQAYATGSPSQIDKAISQWETLLRDTFNDSRLDEQVLILSSYAAALLKRWNLSNQQDDIDRAIATLEKALLQTSHVTSPERYDLLSSLGKAYYDRYDVLKLDKDDLLQAIHYWEDAHGLAVALKQIKISVRNP